MTDLPNLPIATLVHDLNHAELRGDRELRIPAVVYDSRKVTPGAMFVAMRGGYVDGHDFLEMARENGAIAVVVEPDTPDDRVQGFHAVVRVPNTRAALAQIARRFHNDPSQAMTIIGVTGTDGKTTTTLFIEQILRTAGRQTGLISTVGIRIGSSAMRSSARQSTPESIDTQGYLAEMRELGIDDAIIESTSHGLVMHRLDGCDFDVGVVTNVTQEHLDFHGTVENYRAAKGSLLTRVADAQRRGKLGVCVLNADDAGARGLARYAGECTVLRFAMEDESADIRASAIQLTPQASTFDLITPSGGASVSLRIPGRWNVANALAAASVGHALGLAPEQIAQGLHDLVAVPGRMQQVDAGQPFHVLVDYAHTPEALRSVLQEARSFHPKRILVLFGSAGERDVQKRPVQGAIAVEYAAYSIFTSEDPRFEDPQRIIDDIARGAVEAGGEQGVDFDCIEDRRQAIREILGKAGPGDVVILAGKGHERSMIYGSERRPWDEYEVARSALQEIGYGSDLRGAISSAETA